jgi:hypothetical protein
MQPSQTPPNANPLSPELPANDAPTAPQIPEPTPARKGKKQAVLAPKEMVDDTYRAARTHYAIVPDMSFAFAMAARTIKENWEYKGGKFIRKEKPFANYVPPKDDEPSSPPSIRAVPRTAAEARTRWDEAKREGDPGQMTRTANDLLRATEAERAAIGEESPSASEVLAPASNETRPPAEEVSGAAAGKQRSEALDRVSNIPEASPDETANAGGDAENDSPAEAAPRNATLSSFGMHLGNSIVEAASGGLPAVFDPDPDASTIAPSRTTLEYTPESKPLLQLASDQLDPVIENVRRWSMERSKREEEIEYYRTNDPNTGGLERLKYARSRPRRHGQRQPQQVRYRDNWADPDVGWSSEEMRDQLVGAGQRDLTPETLLLLSNYVYPHGDAPPHEQVPPGRGWKVIARYDDSKGTGYYAMALYHERSNSVVIVNRGTEFPDSIFNLSPAKRDLRADYDLFRKRLPEQMRQARAFIREVNQYLKDHPETYRRMHRPGVAGQLAFPSFVVTGHSLGGAAAQMQIATAATELKGLRIRGVTFAAVGVASALFEDRNDWNYARTVRHFADSRLINYTRRGDGLVNRRNQWFQRPERIGRDRMLAGLEMEQIEQRERWAEQQEGGRGLDGATPGSAEARARLLGSYQRNHSLLSYYDRQFATSLDQLIPRY